MAIDPAFQSRVSNAFRLLDNVPAARAMPARGALSQALKGLCPDPITAKTSLKVDRRIARMFTTAAVEMWLRSVHSLLVSAALTKSSPIWASVAGYYSSHYSIRGLAHLLGAFVLFKNKAIVQFEVIKGVYVCEFKPSKGQREHRFYWQALKKDLQFAGDPLFTKNDDPTVSDAEHRNQANYSDHASSGDRITQLNTEFMKRQIRSISQTVCSVPPIPSADNYPEVETVQLIAYHRLVRFRNLVDEVLGDKNRFWTIWRKPDWCADLIDFQLIDQDASRVALLARR